MNKVPLVSIILPYFCDEGYLRIAIDAVFDSSYKNFELILINHGSTDSSREIAHSFKDERIKHIDIPENLGYGGSGLLLQKALKLSKGEYVKFLSADDVIRKNGLELLVDFMQKNQQVDFSFGNVGYIGSKGEDLKADWFSSFSHFCINDTEVDCLRKYAAGISFLPWSGSIVKRSALEHISLNETFVMMFDMSVWVSLLCQGFKIGFLNKKVLNYRIHSEQVSSLRNHFALPLSYWEWSSYWKLFLLINDVEFCKRVWPKGRFVRQIQNKKDIPFAVAYEFFKQKKVFWIRPIAADYIATMLNNDGQRIYLEKVFSYGINEFRRDCAEEINKNKTESSFGKFKKKLYSKDPRYLNILETLFLVFRCIFKKIKNVEHRVKKYTLKIVRDRRGERE